MTEATTIEGSGTRPNTVRSLTHEIRRLGLTPGSTVIVHTSLSSLGWTSGGPVAVIEALLEVLEDSGTLVMPAHTSGLSDPCHWVNPPVPESWWRIVRESLPAYDPQKTPTRGLGQVAELFRTYPGVLRSGHPQVSFSARGPRATGITASLVLDHGLGEGSPLARLYELEAEVLLLGTGFGSNTSIHLAEYRADYPAKKVKLDGAPLWVDGGRQWVELQDIDADSDDFEEIGAAFCASGQVREGTVGTGGAHLMSQSTLVDFAVQWMESNRKR